MTLPSHSTILGAFEHISFPTLNVGDVVAKIDTGADSGAIHCTRIELKKRESDGVKVLRFTPIHSHGKIIETESYEKTHVRSSNGQRLGRYLIDTQVVIGGKEYTIRIGLSDRSDMQYDVLIGRRFLSENNILVDVRINDDLKKEIGDTQ
jgi:hypothetical protein